MLNENACVIFKNEVKIEDKFMSKRNPFFKEKNRIFYKMIQIEWNKRCESSMYKKNFGNWIIELHYG